MKVLLDECLPHSFRHRFPAHQVHTSEWAGFKGKNNGSLLRAAQAAGYQVLITVDQAMPYQQPFGANRKIAIISLRARTNQIEDLLPLVEAISEQLTQVRPGEIATVSG